MKSTLIGSVSAIVAGLASLLAIGWAYPAVVPGIEVTTDLTLTSPSSTEDELQFEILIEGDDVDRPVGAVDVGVEVFVAEGGLYNVMNDEWLFFGDTFIYEEDWTDNGDGTWTLDKDYNIFIDDTPTKWADWGYRGTFEWYFRDSSGNKISGGGGWKRKWEKIKNAIWEPQWAIELSKMLQGLDDY